MNGLKEMTEIENEKIKNFVSFMSKIKKWLQMD